MNGKDSGWGSTCGRRQVHLRPKRICCNLRSFLPEKITIDSLFSCAQWNARPTILAFQEQSPSSNHHRSLKRESMVILRASSELIFERLIYGHMKAFNALVQRSTHSFRGKEHMRVPRLEPRFGRENIQSALLSFNYINEGPVVDISGRRLPLLSWLLRIKQNLGGNHVCLLRV